MSANLTPEERAKLDAERRLSELRAEQWVGEIFFGTLCFVAVIGLSLWVIAVCILIFK